MDGEKFIIQEKEEEKKKNKNKENKYKEYEYQGELSTICKPIRF